MSCLASFLLLFLKLTKLGLCSVVKLLRFAYEPHVMYVWNINVHMDHMDWTTSAESHYRGLTIPLFFFPLVTASPGITWKSFTPPQRREEVLRSTLPHRPAPFPSCTATAAGAMGGPQWAKSQHGGIYLCCAHFLSAAYCLPSCLLDGSHRLQKLASASKLNLFHACPASWQPFSLWVLFNHRAMSDCLFQILYRGSHQSTSLIHYKIINYFFAFGNI